MSRCHSVRPAAWVLAAFATAVACGGEQAQITAHVAPDIAPAAPHPIAVFGVFRDGRMNTKSWDDLSPRLGVLGLEPCVAAYDAELVANASDLAQAVDDYTRSNGVTDSLLAAFGAAAKADLVLVFVISGALPSKRPAADRPRASANMGRGPRGPNGGRPGPRRDPGALEITASLFSTARRTGVAAVSLRYTGKSENEAFAQIDAKLKELFPAASCAEWDLAAHPLDPEAVRGLPED